MTTPLPAAAGAPPGKVSRPLIVAGLLLLAAGALCILTAVVTVPAADLVSKHLFQTYGSEQAEMILMVSAYTVGTGMIILPIMGAV